MEEDLHRSLDSVMEEAMMNFLQLSALSLEAWAMEAALLRLLEEEVAKRGTLTIATPDVLEEVSTMKKHAKRCVLTMKTKLKDMTLHSRLLEKISILVLSTIRRRSLWSSSSNNMIFATPRDVEIGVCHSSKLLTTL